MWDHFYDFIINFKYSKIVNSAKEKFSVFVLSVRLISLAAQKFVSDIANDALQHCKVRSSNQASKTKGKDRRYTLTMEDLAPALAEYGITVRKPPYYV